MSESLSLAQAGAATDARKSKVPGVTPFVPQIPENAPEYVVVDQPYYDGRYFEVGSVVKTDAPIVKELGSPGRCLRPINHKGQWPPAAFVDADRKARAQARKEFLRDLARN